MSTEHHKISPLDMAWLFVESDATPMHVGSLLVFDASKYSAAQVAKLYDDLIGQPCAAAPFNLRMHRQGLALPDWETVDDVDLEYHVQRWAIPAPGSDRELNELVAELHSEALDTSKPLWEFHLIEGLSDQRIAVYIKVHHSIMDGIAGLSLMRSMMDTTPQARLIAPWSADSKIAQLGIVHKEEHQRQSLMEKMRRSLKELRQLPDVAKALRELTWAGMHQKHSDLQVAYTAPRSALNSRVGRHRQFASMSLPLKQLRMISAHAGSTINDVLLACCSGGLKAYLDQCDSKPEKSLISGIPISLRPAGDVALGTAVSFLIASLATDEQDPRERLARIHHSTLAAKTHLQSMPSEALTDYTLLLMAPYMGEILSGLAGRIAPAFNVIVSNVPGPEQGLYFGAAKLLQAYPLSIVTHGQGLNITVLGYQDQLHVGVTACAELPPLSTFARGLTTEFEALKAWAEPSS